MNVNIYIYIYIYICGLTHPGNHGYMQTVQASGYQLVSERLCRRQNTIAHTSVPINAHAYMHYRLASGCTPEVASSHGMVALVPAAMPGAALLAAVDGIFSHYLVYKTEFSIGRNTATSGEPATVDVDLSLEGGSTHVSRNHALVRRDVKGVWSLANVSSCSQTHLFHIKTQRLYPTLCKVNSNSNVVSSSCVVVFDSNSAKNMSLM